MIRWKNLKKCSSSLMNYWRFMEKRFFPGQNWCEFRISQKLFAREGIEFCVTRRGHVKHANRAPDGVIDLSAIRGNYSGLEILFLLLSSTNGQHFYYFRQYASQNIGKVRFLIKVEIWKHFQPRITIKEFIPIQLRLLFILLALYHQ